jgi:hypothetical protein
LEATDWRTLARTPQESQQNLADKTPVKNDNLEDEEKIGQRNVFVEDTDEDEEREIIASALSHSTVNNDMIIALEVSTFGVE